MLEGVIPPGPVLALLVLAAGLAPRWGRPGAVVLALVSLLWFLVNTPVEGQTLVVVTHHHGLTEADLGGLVGLGLAAWVWWRGPRER